MNPTHQQRPYSVRFEWGLTGASAIALDADVSVVVDVLSFTTTLSVAVEQGIEVFPYRWKDNRAQQYAADHHAVLAVGRSDMRGAAVSLSPASVRSASGLERLVLPSPNGSSIAHALAAPHRVCASEPRCVTHLRSPSGYTPTTAREPSRR
ncbi:hypothetical protein [Rhodococcus gordoniae]|uniref:hypothetical protein n=1 Tax=Rhodococcus gordoniae TaxID=223392 RepID=UPI00319E4C6F